MLSQLGRFNIYFCLVASFLAAGCQSPFSKNKEASTIRLHLEVNEDGSNRSLPIPIYRAQTSYVSVEKTAFLSEAFIREAAVVDDLGGFSIRLAFDEHGTRVLDQCSAAYRGQRVAIFSEFGLSSRWLGAPRLTHHIIDGVLFFTPDASREEAERIVLGLNNVAKKIKSQEL